MRIRSLGWFDIFGQESTGRIEHYVLAELGARALERGFGGINIGLGGGGGGLRLLQVDRCEGADFQADAIDADQIGVELEGRFRDL
jgi:hypothetical protein